MTYKLVTERINDIILATELLSDFLHAYYFVWLCTHYDSVRNIQLNKSSEWMNNWAPLPYIQDVGLFLAVM